MQAALAGALLAAWSLRIAHTHWRREGWAPGAREDWRVADSVEEIPGFPGSRGLLETVAR